MNQLVALPIIGVPAVASPFAVEARHPDIALFELGRQFDIAQFEYQRLNKRLQEIEERARSSGTVARELQKENLPETMKDCANLAESTRWLSAFERALGSEWSGLCDAQEDAIPSDELHDRICREAAHSLDGLLVKAKVVAFTCNRYWEQPLDDLDWDQKQVRMLVESIFSTAGGDRVEGYLRPSQFSPTTNDGTPRSDDELVKAVEILENCDRAINQMLKDYDDDAEARDDFKALLERRSESIATLIEQPAVSMVGYCAKASALQLHDVVADWSQHQQIAVSLADDLTGECVLLQRKEGATTPATTHNPDADLLALGQEYERLLDLERPLEDEKSRLYNLADRVRYERMNIDPDDKTACEEAARNRWIEWTGLYTAISKETGYHKAAAAWNRACRQTGRVGKKIMQMEPATLAGLLVRLRVIETHDWLLKVEPAEQLLSDVRKFAQR